MLSIYRMHLYVTSGDVVRVLELGIVITEETRGWSPPGLGNDGFLDGTDW